MDAQAQLDRNEENKADMFAANHFRLATDLLADSPFGRLDYDREIARAQVHATLALCTAVEALTT